MMNKRQAMMTTNTSHLSPRTLALIWEVYARIGLRPEQAVHLLRRQGIFVTPGFAKRRMYQARRQNRLCLVFPR